MEIFGSQQEDIDLADIMVKISQVLEKKKAL